MRQLEFQPPPEPDHDLVVQVPVGRPEEPHHHQDHERGPGGQGRRQGVLRKDRAVQLGRRQCGLFGNLDAVQGAGGVQVFARIEDPAVLEQGLSHLDSALMYYADATTASPMIHRAIPIRRFTNRVDTGAPAPARW